MLPIRTGKPYIPPVEIIPEGPNTKLLAAIEQNTAATVTAVTSITLPAPAEPTPPVDLYPILEALQNIKQEQPQVLEWHFEIKRDSLKLITDVIARAVPREI